MLVDPSSPLSLLQPDVRPKSEVIEWKKNDLGVTTYCSLELFENTISKFKVNSHLLYRKHLPKIIQR